MCTAKQLCKNAPTPSEVGGVPLNFGDNTVQADAPEPYLSQGCLPTSLYSPEAFQVPNGISLPYFEPLGFEGVPVMARSFQFDPYANTAQSTGLRVIVDN